MASWTPPVTLATGAVLPSTAWNGLANDTLFLYQRPYALLFNSVSTSMPSAAPTQVPLIEGASNYGFSVTSSNAVVPLAGIYSVQFAIQFISGSGSGGSFVQAQAFQNGNEVLSGSLVPSYTVEPASNGAGLISCAANDQIGLVVYNDSGVPLMTSAMANATYLHIAFMGSQ